MGLGKGLCPREIGCLSALDTGLPGNLLWQDVALTNEADTIGPVRLPLWSSSWTLTFAKKREVFGAENRPAVGGPTDALVTEEDAQLAEEDEDLLSLIAKGHRFSSQIKEEGLG
jgi:hypothetical protein